MEKIRFIITEESMKRLHDSLVMLRASLFSEELKANQSTYISEIGAELSKATIDKEPETCTWTEIEDEDGNRTYTDYTEQLQIYFDGSSKIYSDNTNIKLVKAEDLDTVIAIASSYLSENGTVKLYESQDLIRRLN